jgi:hypothetical protein
MASNIWWPPAPLSLTRFRGSGKAIGGGLRGKYDGSRTRERKAPRIKTIVKANALRGCKCSSDNALGSYIALWNEIFFAPRKPLPIPEIEFKYGRLMQTQGSEFVSFYHKVIRKIAIGHLVSVRAILGGDCGELLSGSIISHDRNVNH